MLTIYIDADACPVKAETYRIAKRYGLLVMVIANQWINMPNDPMIRLEVVDDGFDAADNWICEKTSTGDIVITDDIPLAARCLTKGSRVLTNRGEIRDSNSISDALAQRQLLQYLRGAGDIRGGSKPMQDEDRHHFMQQLDKLIHAVKKHG
jgi:uncharacterized protein